MFNLIFGKSFKLDFSKIKYRWIGCKWAELDCLEPFLYDFCYRDISEIELNIFHQIVPKMFPRSSPRNCPRNWPQLNPKIFSEIFLSLARTFPRTGTPRRIWARQGPIFYPNFFDQLFLMKTYWNPKSRQGPSLGGRGSVANWDFISIFLHISLGHCWKLL